MTVDNLQVVARDTDGNLSAIPLGNLCHVCAERPKARGDCLCAECRRAFWYWERWLGEPAEADRTE